MEKPRKKPGPPKGKTNNPNGRPKGIKTVRLTKRVPEVLLPDCVNALNDVLNDKELLKKRIKNYE